MGSMESIIRRNPQRSEILRYAEKECIDHVHNEAFLSTYFSEDFAEHFEKDVISIITLGNTAYVAEYGIQPYADYAAAEYDRMIRKVISTNN